MRKQANVSAIIQDALKGAGGSVDTYNVEKTASLVDSYAVPLAQNLQKVAALLRAQPQEADVTVEDVKQFALKLAAAREHQ